MWTPFFKRTVFSLSIVAGNTRSNLMKHSAIVFFVFLCSFLFITIYFNCYKLKLFRVFQTTKISNIQHEGLWEGCPSLELALRMNSSPVFVKLYESWFLKSLELFWPEDCLNLTLVLDDESELDHVTGERLSNLWPKPNTVYLKPENANFHQGKQRRRMYLDYFYPEKYVSAEYVGFVDADTMFVSVVTPQALFNKSKPTVQARVGEPFWQQHWECWSDVTEYLLGEKEALQCMSYFPVIFKVKDIIEMRNYVAKRLGPTFLHAFYESMQIRNDYFKGSELDDCMCQFSVICNYVWYFHRDEYDFHLQMTPDDTWNGENRRHTQQTTAYIQDIGPAFKIPKPRIAIHARHYKENGKYMSSSTIDTTKEPYASQLERRVQEGVCFAIGFDRCPSKCYSFDADSLQVSLYSFEFFDWLWDQRCLEEQRKHYVHVRALVNHNEKQGKRMFGMDPPYDGLCTGAL